jgi:hypothetical protein
MVLRPAPGVALMTVILKLFLLLVNVAASWQSKSCRFSRGLVTAHRGWRKESQSCWAPQPALNAQEVPCYDGMCTGTQPVSSTQNHRQGSCAGVAPGSSTTHGVPSSASNSTPPSTLQPCGTFQWSSCWQYWQTTVGVTHCCICTATRATSTLGAQYGTLKYMTEIHGPGNSYFKRVRARRREARLYVI